MTRFVLLSTQRSGSTWVVDMLDSHPRIAAYSELFMHAADGRPKWAGERDLPYWTTFLKEHGPPRSRLGRTYLLWQYLGRVYASRADVEAAGFKLMYSQVRLSRPLLPALVLRRVRILHLIRRNALDVVVSKEAAAARGAMHAREADAGGAGRVRLAPATLAERIAAQEREVSAARVRFSRLRLPYREIVYEDLVRDGAAGFASVLEFLGVDPSSDALSSRLRKVTPSSHADVIENYDEVRAALAGTQFASLLR